MRRILTALTLALPLAAPLAAQPFGPQSGFTVENPVLRRIYALGMDSSQAASLAQVLMDSVGPRLTGSPGIFAGNDWLLRTYRSWGVNARNERYGTWRSWRRGPTHIDLVAPRVRSLEGMMLAWSPGTGGQPVRGPVVLLPDLADTAAFTQFLGTVSGKFVAVSFPEPTCRPDDNWERWGTAQTFERMRTQRTAARSAWASRLTRAGVTARDLPGRLEQAGAAGVVTSQWSQGWGVTKIFNARTTRIPTLDVSCEDYGLVARLALNNQGPVLEVTAQSEDLGEQPVFNTIAEIRGRELPNEYVVLSAHFDSWDGGSGATDNGTGTITMLEALRILRQVYPNPRRTIIVGHWSGEEQGLNGSRAFAADHPEVVSGLQALFNQDNGTGRVSNMSAGGLVLAAGTLARWLAQVPVDLSRNITYGFTGSAAGGGSDNASFACYGAPSWGLGSNPWDYFAYTWHTNRDTYDKIAFDEIRNNATLTAMLTYLASEDRERVPRDRRTVFSPGQGGQPGGWPACTPATRSSDASTR